MRNLIKTILISLILSPNSGISQVEKVSYGIIAALNYPTIGARFDNYVGEGNPMLGMYLHFNFETGLNIGHPTKNKSYTIISDQFIQRFSFSLQPSFSYIGFREKNLDLRYTNYFIELSGLLYYQPFVFVDEFRIFTGIRPSILTSGMTEILDYGNYVTMHDPSNFNRPGRLDFCIPLGLSMRFSNAVYLELVYNHAITDNNSGSVIQGRTSTIELGLRLNAVGLASQLTKKEELLHDQILKMKKGSLMVMLMTPNSSEIKHLKESQDKDELGDYVKSLFDRNKSIIHSFKTRFNFCPVYYFMDSSAYKIVSGKFEGVFVNESLVPDQSIKPDSSNYFVASFCEDISTYTDKHVFGLFIYDHKINPLPKPYNVPSNLIGVNLDGDPLNFFKLKYYHYDEAIFDRIVNKFNNRLNRY